MSLGHGRLALRARDALVIAALSGLCLGGAASRASADEPITPTGIWYTDGQESIIKVHNCTAEPTDYCGTIVWLKEPTESDGSPKLDKLNKDPTKKTKPLVGLDILLGMKAEEDHWTGKAYNPEDGKLYDITFKVKTDKEENDQADLRGCLLRFLCKTETFNRAKEVPGGDPTAAADPAVPGKKKKKLKRDSAHS